MRFADVLMDDGDLTAASFQCFSPRLLLSRWLPKGRKRSCLDGGDGMKAARKSSGRKLDGGDEERGGRNSRGRRLDGGDRPSNPAVELRANPAVELRAERHVGNVSGQRANEDSVNVAVGFGLFYLIAASKNELSKMIELRKEMEVLVHSARNEFQTQTKGILYETSDSNNNHACSTIDTYESLCSDGCFSFHNLSHEIPTESLISYSRDQSLPINTTSDGKCVEGIDELEAELVSELERLQVCLDASDYPSNQGLKVPTDDSTSVGNSSVSYIEAIDDIHEADSIEQVGVCPRELEKKLHELLESRQQDKIEELEAALRRAHQKIFEREKEVSWWKDTASMFSHHVPKASRLSRLAQTSYRIF